VCPALGVDGVAEDLHGALAGVRRVPGLRPAGSAPPGCTAPGVEVAGPLLTFVGVRRVSGVIPAWSVLSDAGGDGALEVTELPVVERP